MNKLRYIAGLLSVFLASLLINCDPFRSDTIPPDKKVAINTINYYILPQTSAVIDMKSLVTFTLTNLVLEISKGPKLGKVTALPNFLLRYDPSTKFLSGTDEFQISITESLKIVKQFIITVTIKNRTEEIPCGLTAIEDLVCISPGATAKVLYLSNDRLCGVDREKVTRSIYLKPEHGTAVLSGDTLFYSQTPGYQGPDYLVYRLTLTGNPGLSLETFGLVTIPPSSVIRFEATAQNVMEGHVVKVPVSFERAIACEDTIRIQIGGDALYNTHYKSNPAVVNGLIKIPVGKGGSSAEITVTTIDNDVYEGNKSIRFQMISSMFALHPDTVTVLTLTIGDDEGPSYANFAANKVTVLEGNSSGIVLDIPLSSPAKGSGNITVALSPGNAIYGTNFRTIPEAANGSIILDVAPGQTHASFTAVPVKDFRFTGDFEIVFSITSVNGVVKLGNTLVCSMTLDDDETPQSVSFTQTGWSDPICDYGYCSAPQPISGGTLGENTSSGIVAALAFSEPAAGSGTITITWQEEPKPCGTAIGYGITFTTNIAPSLPNTIVVPVLQGDIGTGFTIYPIDNGEFAGDIYVNFRISSTSGALVKGAMLTYKLRIADDEVPSFANFTSPNQTVDESDNSGFLVEIPLSQPALGSGTISISTSGTYGTEFTTDPPKSGQFIALPVAPNQTIASFKAFPIENARCGNSYLSFEIFGCGFVKQGDHSVMSLVIVDNDAADGIFTESSGTISENSTGGIVVQINFSKPLTENSMIYISPSSYLNRIFAKPPVETIWDYNGDYYVFQWSVPAGATSTSLTVYPVNDQTKNGNFHVDFMIGGAGCIRGNNVMKYSLTVVDDD